MEKGGSVYIMTNKHHTVLYTGVTSDLYSRVVEHKTGEYPRSFTNRYNVHKLVYFENYTSIEEAIEYEKAIKKGNRARKEKLINEINPEWKDLFEEVKEW